MSEYANLTEGRLKVTSTLTDSTGANKAAVNASGQVSVTGTITPAPPVPATAAAPTVATVNAASAVVVAANASRTGLILINKSSASQTISLGFSGNAAVVDQGVTLRVGDGYNMGQYDFTVGAVEAIASAVGATLLIQEFS